MSPGPGHPAKVDRTAGWGCKVRSVQEKIPELSFSREYMTKAGQTHFNITTPWSWHHRERKVSFAERIKSVAAYTSSSVPICIPILAPILRSLMSVLLLYLSASQSPFLKMWRIVPNSVCRGSVQLYQVLSKWLASGKFSLSAGSCYWNNL